MCFGHVLMHKLSQIVLMTLLSCVAYADTQLVVETAYSKGVNYNAGLEVLIKGTTNLNDVMDLKYGVSEQYDAYRANPFTLNHGGRRFDIGFLVNLAPYLKVGYTHSERSPFEGFNSGSIYLQNSIDTISIRWEFNL